MLCCTHTHTGPQTHSGFIGMGHADPDYMAFLSRQVVAAFVQSTKSLAACTLRYIRTRALKGVSVNRRQRRPSTPPPSSISTKNDDTTSTVRWFEKAGRTSLGQRPDGPRKHHADVLRLDSDKGTIATVDRHRQL